MLHLFGIDHERLTFKHPSRRFRLKDVEGKVGKGKFYRKYTLYWVLWGKGLGGILGIRKEGENWINSRNIGNRTNRKI